MQISLFQAAQDVLMLADPQSKLAAVVSLQRFWLDSQYSHEPFACCANTILEPGHPQRPELVHPREVPRRKLQSMEGRAALVHAVCHIEFNAINLALDAVQRFQHMPKRYYTDWIRVAADEARHFDMLESRLREMGFQYGDFVAHNGLWEMALKTRHSVAERMALVPRVLEARGLDVTPGLIQRLKNIEDNKTANILEIILKEEVEHVRIGTHWFRYACEKSGVDAEAYFISLLQKYAVNSKGTLLHRAARRKAGFTELEIKALTQ
jgi:uncharacterized ferritin-like protein (DUF455 family)